MNDIMNGMQEASPETRKNASSNSIQITPKSIKRYDEHEQNQLSASHLSVDINDESQLEAQGLRRVQIEGFQTAEDEN